MAFDVTPTSGFGPSFEFTATFENKNSINTPYYSLFFRSSSEVGVCPAPTNSGVHNPNAVLALLDTGTYILSPFSVPAGSCRNFRLYITDTNNTVVSMMSVNIDNI